MGYHQEDNVGLHAGRDEPLQLGVHGFPAADLAAQYGLVHDRPQRQRRRVGAGQDLLAAHPELDELVDFVLQQV